MTEGGIPGFRLNFLGAHPNRTERRAAVDFRILYKNRPTAMLWLASPSTRCIIARIAWRLHVAASELPPSGTSDLICVSSMPMSSESGSSVQAPVSQAPAPKSPRRTAVHQTRPAQRHRHSDPLWPASSDRFRESQRRSSQMEPRRVTTSKRRPSGEPFVEMTRESVAMRLRERWRASADMPARPHSVHEVPHREQASDGVW